MWTPLIQKESGFVTGSCTGTSAERRIGLHRFPISRGKVSETTVTSLKTLRRIYNRCSLPSSLDPTSLLCFGHSFFSGRFFLGLLHPDPLRPRRGRALISAPPGGIGLGKGEVPFQTTAHRLAFTDFRYLDTKSARRPLHPLKRYRAFIIEAFHPSCHGESDSF